MKERSRFYCDSVGPNKEAEEKILAKTLELSNSVKNASRIVFVSYTKSNTAWLTRWFGDGADKKLFAGVSIKGSPVSAKFESLNTYNSLDREIVVALGLESNDILKIEDNYDIAAIVALPWLKGGVDKWAKITEAVELLSDTLALAYPLPPCLVQKALTELMESVNMSTGVGHPSDEAQCKTYLRALHHEGIALDEPVIESFLFRLGWQKEHLDEIMAIIQKINTGRSFQGGDKTGFKYHIKRWEAECV